MSVLFLNDSPVIQFGLAPAFRRLGRAVAFLPRLWVHESSQQVLLAQEWLRANEVPSIVFFEGFTGSRPIHPSAINVFRDAGARSGTGRSKIRYGRTKLCPGIEARVHMPLRLTIFSHLARNALCVTDDI